mmetsp:Transcript_32193/g.66349  ORF Transcript_32193/g.66349 Transcript_32193/m.66349 type:complete len:215 (-) Transcript_32193:55-699(-)
MQADEVGQSVYDLGEDEQLALAMQQSLAESLEEEPGACPDPDSAAGVFPGAAADAGLAPETEAPEEVLTSPAPVPGGWEGVLPPPVAPPAPEGERDFHASSNDPEWAGSAAEEAAGGTVQVTQPPRPPPPQRPSGSGEAFAKQVPPRPQPRPAANSRLLDEVVQRSLELAKARQFEEAERCLAQLASEHPELAASREMIAAQQAVTMCKQLNGA